MTKSVSTREARDQIGALIHHVNTGNDAVIVTSYRKPRAVLISFATYEDMRLKLAHIRRVEALGERKTLLDRVRANNIRLIARDDVGSAVADDPDAA